jgi:hypothetical protein
MVCCLLCGYLSAAVLGWWNLAPWTTVALIMLSIPQAIRPATFSFHQTAVQLCFSLSLFGVIARYSG